MKKTNWTTENIGDLTGKTIVVTGANSGIGFEATKLFAANGAKVIMGCRSIERATTAKDAILAEYPDAQLVIETLDLSSFDSIEKFATSIKNSITNIDILLNNAGIMTVPYGSTKEGYELQIGVNHFGHFYLTMSLLKLITSTPESRIVNIASIAHKYGSLKPKTFTYEKGKRYSKMKAYAQSKLSNLLFTYKLQELLGDKVKVLAAHPGISSTNLGSHIKILRFRVTKFIFGMFNQSQYMGSLPGVRAATDPNAKGAEYYGPRGFMEIKGFPVLVKSKKKSHNVELQNELWKYSTEFTGLDIN